MSDWSARFAGTNYGACYDCGRRYGDRYGFPDLVVPNDVWAKISPTGDEGGLLCPSCMARRAEALGLSGVPASFMSGPFVVEEAIERLQRANASLRIDVEGCEKCHGDIGGPCR